MFLSENLKKNENESDNYFDNHIYNINLDSLLLDYPVKRNI